MTLDTEAALVEKALALAVAAHRGQKDKHGEPYIWHPIRVALRLNSQEEQCAALLHDVVEDCGISLEDLAQEGFPSEVLDAVDHLTRREEETYEEFVRRCAGNPIARKVKLADLADNTDPARNPLPRLAQRYAEAREILESTQD